MTYCKEYIERNAILELYQLDDPVLNKSGHVPLPVIRQNIMDIPAADVAPVVRCRDCAVPHNRWTGCPKLSGLVTPPDFYCGFGERKGGTRNG